MSAPDPDAGRIKDVDQARVAALSEYHFRKMKAMAEYFEEKWTGTGIACCGETQIRDVKTSLWAPGCVHFRSTR